jgi:thiol-disulfide isomerase/thioredoxin
LCFAGIAAAANVDFKPFVHGSWKAILQTRAGKPMVVHFWGVTCGPCRVEMPQWGAFLKSRPDMNLIVVNADLVPNDEVASSRMLSEAGLQDANNWMFDQRIVERLRNEVDPAWQGEIPLTLLIASDGKITKIEGTADLKIVANWLDEQKTATGAKQ